MNKLTLAIVASALLAVLPIVHADETKADCEDGQPWIGYTDTSGPGGVRDTYNQASDKAGAPVRANPCEGEQWDGQDQVSSAPDQETSTPGEGCTPAVTPSDANGATNVNLCSTADPASGSGTDDTSRQAATSQVYGFRLSANPGTKEVYVSNNIRFVGTAAVYEGAGDPGKVSTTGVYLRDNTNDLPTGTNFLAIIVHTAGITQGFADEGDCTQAQYEQSAETKANGGTPTCHRDNTAVTLELLG